MSLNQKDKPRLLSLITLIFVGLSLPACSANESILKSGNTSSSRTNAAGPQQSSFTTDLEAMRTAGFTFIYVLRRKDGGTIDSEDVRIIKQHTADTNRRVKADNDRAIIIGSNFQIPTTNLTALDGRFLVEHHSEPAAVVADVNANSNR